MYISDRLGVKKLLIHLINCEHFLWEKINLTVNICKINNIEFSTLPFLRIASFNFVGEKIKTLLIIFHAIDL